MKSMKVVSILVFLGKFWQPVNIRLKSIKRSKITPKEKKKTTLFLKHKEEPCIYVKKNFDCSSSEMVWGAPHSQ